MPLEEGGQDIESNVQGLCHECHEAKSKKERARARSDSRGVSILPKWLPPSLVPVIVVCGPPGSGKTTYVNQRAAESDLVIDVDVIAAHLSGKPLYLATYDERMEAIRERNRLLAGLGKRSSFARAWLIATAGTPLQRDFWRDRYGEVIVMATEKAECLLRIEADERRSMDAKARAVRAVLEWQ